MKELMQNLILCISNNMMEQISYVFLNLNNRKWRPIAKKKEVRKTEESNNTGRKGRCGTWLMKTC